MNKASNAVLALCRAFYGKCITEDVYAELSCCKSLNELLTSLRAKTVYADVLENALADTVSIEESAKRFLFDRYMSICRYQLAVGNKFYDYFITGIEVDEILKATLHMFGNNTDEYMINFSPFVDRHVSVDLYALGRANSFEEIQSALEGTEYEKLYRQCLNTTDKTYLTFEETFNKYLDDYLLKLSKKCYKGKELKEVLEIVRMQKDIALISRMVRICKYYPFMIATGNAKLTVPELTLLTKKQFNALVNSTTEGEIKEALSNTVYKNCVGENTETQLYRLVYRKCKKQIRFSSCPGTVTYCYMFLAENEKRNITYITEGIKYSVAPENIKAGIVI